MPDSGMLRLRRLSLLLHQGYLHRSFAHSRFYDVDRGLENRREESIAKGRRLRRLRFRFLDGAVVHCRYDTRGCTRAI